MRLFEPLGPVRLDPSKKTVLCFTRWSDSEYTHWAGAGKVLAEALEATCNVVRAGDGLDPGPNRFSMNCDYSAALERKADGASEDYLASNVAAVDEMVDASFEGARFDAALVENIDFFRLPLGSYVSRRESALLHDMQNEYFDYVGDDESYELAVERVNERVVREWPRRVSPIAFSTKRTYAAARTLARLSDTGRLQGPLNALVVDPVFFSPYFDLRGDLLRCRYFADDRRGTRRFEKFPLDFLQHACYDAKFAVGATVVPESERRGFFFAGTLFHSKGARRALWDRYFAGLRGDDVSLFVPFQKNSVTRAGRESKTDREAVSRDFSELAASVASHPCLRQSVAPADLFSSLGQFRYGFVAPCVSHNDSLNFRPFLYSMRGVVPLLAPDYDPAFLQVPRELQERLVVSDGAGIRERVDYFDSHPDSRAAVLEELRRVLGSGDDRLSRSREVLDDAAASIMRASG